MILPRMLGINLMPIQPKNKFCVGFVQKNPIRKKSSSFSICSYSFDWNNNAVIFVVQSDKWTSFIGTAIKGVEVSK